MKQITFIIIACFIVSLLGACSRHRAQPIKTTINPVFDNFHRNDYVITEDTTFEVKVKSYLGVVYPTNKPATQSTEWNSSVKNPLMFRLGHFKINAVGLVTGLALSAATTYAIQQAGGQKTKTVSNTIFGFPVGSSTVKDGYKISATTAAVPGLLIGFTLNNYLFSPKYKAKHLAKTQLLNTFDVDYLLNTRYKFSTRGNLLYRSAVVEIKSKGIRFITGERSFTTYPNLKVD